MTKIIWQVQFVDALVHTPLAELTQRLTMSSARSDRMGLTTGETNEYLLRLSGGNATHVEDDA